MGKSVNRVTLLGNIGKAPEFKYLPNGTGVANLSIATEYSYKDRSGEYQKTTEWHNVVAYGKLAEIIRDYVGKGSKLYLEGRLQTRSWDDKNGAGKRYRTEIIADELTLLGGGNRQGGEAREDDFAQRAVEQTRAEYEGPGVTDDDIPF